MNKKRNTIIVILVCVLILAVCLYTMLDQSFDLISPEFSRIGVPIIFIFVLTILGSFLFGKYKANVVDSSNDFSIGDRNVNDNIFSTMNKKSKENKIGDIEEKLSSGEYIKCSKCGHPNKKENLVCERCNNYLK